LLVLVAWRLPIIRKLTELPRVEPDSQWLGLDTEVQIVV
jgi:hypothetical protein